jgi:hypothetical protein
VLAVGTDDEIEPLLEGLQRDANVSPELLARVNLVHESVQSRPPSSAETNGVRRYTTRMEDCVWTFRRRDDQLLLRREQTPSGVNLVVVENGTSRSFAFSDVERLVSFQSDMEAFLVRTGWTFIAFTPERRSGRDRREMPRITERRRWWTDGRPDDVR